MLRIRDVYPRSDFFPSRIPDPGSASKNLSILTQKMFSKLQEIWSGLFIPDPESWLFKGGLVARCHSFWFIFTVIEQSHNIYIYTTRREPLLLSSLHPLGRGPPLGCRAEIRTRACRTASRCAAIWATPHFLLIPDPGVKKAPDPGTRIHNIESIHGMHIRVRTYSPARVGSK